MLVPNKRKSSNRGMNSKKKFTHFFFRCTPCGQSLEAEVIFEERTHCGESLEAEVIFEERTHSGESLEADLSFEDLMHLVLNFEQLVVTQQKNLLIFLKTQISKEDTIRLAKIRR